MLKNCPTCDKVLPKTKDTGFLNNKNNLKKNEIEAHFCPL